MKLGLFPFGIVALLLLFPAKSFSANVKPKLFHIRPYSVKIDGNLKVFSPLFCESPYKYTIEVKSFSEIKGIGSKDYTQCWNITKSDFKSRFSEEKNKENENFAFIFDENVPLVRVVTDSTTSSIFFNNLSHMIIKTNNRIFDLKQNGRKIETPLKEREVKNVDKIELQLAGNLLQTEHNLIHYFEDRISREEVILKLKELKTEFLIPFIDQIEKEKFVCNNKIVNVQKIDFDLSDRKVSLDMALTICPSQVGDAKFRIQPVGTPGIEKTNKQRVNEAPLKRSPLQRLEKQKF